MAGGNTLLEGLAPRFRNEVTTNLVKKNVFKISQIFRSLNLCTNQISAVLPSEMASRLDIATDSTRQHAAWIGGSMFASLSTFPNVCITKAEWEEGKGDPRALVAAKSF